ncbi:MAG: type II toxin-antitoxin system ParD family antitoxin [Pseudomonadota bacterium]|nr:type II toxin-antitoxin system ParD family antitoxin [Pseudomonadota bacterium]
MRANKPLSVTLGPLAARAEARVKSGAYNSLSEVVRAGLRALDREEAAFDAIMRAKVADALAADRPAVPAAEAFAELDTRIAEYKAARDI